MKLKLAVGMALAVLVGSAPAHADNRPFLLAAGKKDKKAEEAAKKAEEEAAAAKKAEEEAAAAKKAEEEAAARKAEEEAAARKAEEEAAAAKKAEEEAAAKKAADDAAAKKGSEDGAAAAADEGRGFRQTYLPHWFDDTLSPYAQDQKWKFIIFTFLAGQVLPAPELWLPLVLWDAKPKFDAGALLKPFIIHFALQIAGHVALFVPWMLCIGPGWYIFYIPMFAAQLGWGFFMAWSQKIVMLQAWDDLMKAQNGGKPLDVGGTLSGEAAPEAPKTDAPAAQPAPAANPG